MNNLEFRRWSFSFNCMEYSSEMAGGLEQYFSNDDGERLSGDMQFTGLTDVNGVKIFEGDILRCIDDYKYDVIFDSGNFIAVNPDDKLDFYFLDDLEFEVIGNIHEETK